MKKKLVISLVLILTTPRANAISTCNVEQTQNCMGNRYCSDVSGTNYQECTRGKLNANCTCSAGTTVVGYRCQAGYYGQWSTGMPTCTKCPSLGTATGTTDGNAYSTTIEDCYIKKGNYSDNTGTFTITGTCQY